MTSEQMEGAKVACTHHHVEYVGEYNALRRTHSDSWKCRDCGLRFAPVIGDSAASPNYTWMAGWYATRLHAVENLTNQPEKFDKSVQAICGAWVYPNPKTDWARRKLEQKQPPKCKICLRLCR
jgi:ribosomal protein L37AE/L43A